MKTVPLFPALAGLGAVLSAGAPPASAHAFLKRAVPAVGGTVDRAPDSLVLGFSKGVEPRFCDIVVRDAAGAAVPAGPVRAAGDDRHLAVGLPPLAPGTYRVAWRVVATDTHRTSGDFAFTVGGAAR